MEPMKDYIITIARGYGSGGKQIAIRLAKALGIKYYDRDLIRKASEETGINEALFNLADETYKKKFFRRYTTQKTVSPESSDYLSQENLFNLQAQIIKKIADSGEPAIIVGRCAHHILKDRPNVIKVYIHADHERCMENVKALNGVTDAEAEALISKFDTERAQYHKYFTNTDWSDVRNYDICLNTSQIDFDKCVQIIISYLKIMDELE